MKASNQNLVTIEFSQEVVSFWKTTNRAISTKPQEDVACSAVQPSLSQALTSAPCSTRNFTTLKLSSMQAYRTPALNSTILPWQELVNCHMAQCDSELVIVNSNRIQPIIPGMGMRLRSSRPRWDWDAHVPRPRWDVKISRRDWDETLVALETWSRC